MSVNKEHIRLWVKALRSGKYKQGQGYLQSNDRYCCLGVACEVAIENGVSIIKTKLEDFKLSTNGPIIDNCYVAYDSSGGVLPLSVMDWLGLKSEDPVLTSNVRATTANDSYEWDFLRIADALERTYL